MNSIITAVAEHWEWLLIAVAVAAWEVHKYRRRAADPDGSVGEAHGRRWSALSTAVCLVGSIPLVATLFFLFDSVSGGLTGTEIAFILGIGLFIGLVCVPITVLLGCLRLARRDCVRREKFWIVAAMALSAAPGVAFVAACIAGEIARAKQ